MLGAPVTPSAPEHGGESGVTPGATGVQVWDTDFGRIAVLVCFDINYFELWQEAFGKSSTASAPAAELVRDVLPRTCV